MQADISAAARAAGCDDAVAFCRHLAEHAGVAAIPSAVFYDTRGAGRTIVRFAFCKRQDVIAEAIGRLSGYAM